MSNDKKIVMLDVAAELIMKVHSDLCYERKFDDADNAQDILRRILLLKQDIKGDVKK